MSAIEVGAISILAICVFIYAGAHVSVALALCSFLGVWAIKENVWIAVDLLALAATDSISSYDFAVVPLFVIMGLLMRVAGVAKDSFNAANYLLRHVMGGVGIATVLGNAMLSAVTGVTIASVAIFTKLAVPEMLRLGYKPRFAVGVVAGSGVLGMLIPPSLLMIVYCVITEASIGKLFIASIIPGLLLTLLLSVGIVLMAWLWPSFVGKPAPIDSSNTMSGGEIVRALFPSTALVLLIFGGIFGGIFTATEAGATGALGALFLALARRKLTWTHVWAVMRQSGTITSSILILVIAANMYSRMLALSNMPGAVSTWLAGADMSYYTMVTMYVLLLLFLGTFLDSVSTILLSVPLLFPVFQAHGADVIWFGVITILATEMGIVTPPLGISAFVVKSTLNDSSITLEDIYAGSYPFLAFMLLTLVLLIAFPVITTGILR